MPPQRKRLQSLSFMSKYWDGQPPWRETEPNNIWPQGGTFTRGNLVLSQGNPFQRLGKVPYAIGGDFQVLTKKYVEENPFGDAPTHFSKSRNPTDPTGPHFHGVPHARFADISDANWVQRTATSKLDLLAMGSTAIARCKPDNPYMSLSTSLGELRAGGAAAIPGIQSWKERTERAKAAGSEYLNLEFGWKPLVADVKDFCRIVTSASALVDSYRKNSGKPIKRAYEFPVYVEDDIVSVGNQPLGNSFLMQFVERRLGPTLKRTRYERRVWFEGCFVYHLPPQGTWMEYEALANKLLGTRLTPEVLYNLAPWTWALDWVTNTGDVISNITSFMTNGLVMRYGYIMETKTHEITYVAPGIEFYSYPGGSSFSQSFIAETKTRYSATPYGFGLNTSTFTGRQWAILGALGISRR